ncbi:MAG: hypothetical protein HLUCCA11_22100 [Phormidesmis priestleyi Ana]|uniref:DUF5615 domain-containing protein n=1 Tax=Phormidesmis priestleyi Ana TaxID=1666911 RepID=A0A0P7YQ07_9CYAN|nr:MAG: hypothetical protein HLUCCA11_22100 [Phormidesmis priestleyi Ana]
MKFLVDAQLPKRLARFLASRGHDAVHTQDLSKGNTTSDADINLLSLREERIVITKDADFVQSFLLKEQPYKLLLVATGNIKNAELEDLFAKHLNQLTESFEHHGYLELGYDAIVIHQ